MAFIKQCTGTVEVTKCAVCKENATFEVNGQWYCSACIAKLEAESPTEQ